MSCCPVVVTAIMGDNVCGAQRAVDSLIQIRSSGIRFKEIKGGACLPKEKNCQRRIPALSHTKHCISVDPRHGEYTVFTLVFTVHYRARLGAPFGPIWPHFRRLFRVSYSKIPNAHVPAGPVVSSKWVIGTFERKTSVPPAHDQHEMSLFPTFFSTMPSELIRVPLCQSVT